MNKRRSCLGPDCGVKDTKGTVYFWLGFAVLGALCLFIAHHCSEESYRISEARHWAERQHHTIPPP